MRQPPQNKQKQKKKVRIVIILILKSSPGQETLPVHASEEI